MGNQRTFASMAWNGKGKVTRRERFLAEMDAVIPWPRLLKLIEPHYPKAGNGRQPLGLEKMLRIDSCSSGSTCRTRRPKTRSTTASRCGALPGSSWARRWCRTRARFSLSPPTGAPWVNSSDLRFDQRAVGRTSTVAAVGNHRGRDHHRGAEFDQERQCDP